MATENFVSNSQRKYDFVIFGATGFTGQFTLEEMIKTDEKHTSKFTWAVAGRNKNKLKQSVANAFRALNKKQEDIPMIIADVNDPASLANMCQNTKIVLNCIGPYRFYGEPVVKACVENKTHHLDISGEPQFLENMQLKYHQRAKDAGVYVIGACGYDSIPSEMGIHLLRKNFPGDIAYVEVYLRVITGSCGGGGNYATWISAIHSFAHAKELAQLRAKLLPEKIPRSKFGAPKKTFFHSNVVDGWCLPLPSADKPIAIRTMYHEYVEHKIRPFQVNYFIRVGSFSYAFKVVLAVYAFNLFASYPYGRALLEKYPELFSLGIFKRGGPTRQQVTEGGFEATLIGVGYKDKLPNVHADHKNPPDHKISLKITGPGAAYIATPICMIQAGLVLLEEMDKLPGEGGVYTPGVAFANTTIIDRLKRNGIDFLCGAPNKIGKSKL